MQLQLSCMDYSPIQMLQIQITGHIASLSSFGIYEPAPNQLFLQSFGKQIVVLCSKI